MRWIQDEIAEGILAKYDVAVDIETVAVADIDDKESLKNNAWLTADLNQEYVDRYASIMGEKEAVFNMIVLRRLENGRLIVVSGNHRLGAVKKRGELRTIEAYVIEVTDARTREILPFMLNLRNSRGIDREEVDVRAVRFTTVLGMTNQEAADALHIPVSQVAAARIRKAVIDDLASLNISSRGITPTTLKTLHKVRGNKNVLRECGKLAHQITNVKEFASIVGDMLKAPNEAEQLAFIEAKRASMLKIGHEKQSVQTRNSQSLLLGTITKMEKIIDGKSSLTQLQITNDDQQAEVAARLRRLAKQLDAIASSNRK